MLDKFHPLIDTTASVKITILAKINYLLSELHGLGEHICRQETAIKLQMGLLIILARYKNGRQTLNSKTGNGKEGNTGIM